MGKSLVNFLAYVAVALIAVALIMGKLLGWLVNPNIVATLNLIAQIIAYAITAVYAFSFAKAKKGSAWMIIYVLCIILIIVFTFLNYRTIIG